MLHKRVSYPAEDEAKSKGKEKRGMVESGEVNGRAEKRQRSGKIRSIDSAA